MKLMDIDQEHLGIPDTQYDATITMSSAEFQRICRDLAALGESVKIEASKEGVRFSSEGEVGQGSVLLKQSAGTDRAGSSKKKAAKRDPDDEEEEEMDEDKKPDVDEEGGEFKAVRPRHPKCKRIQLIKQRMNRTRRRPQRRESRPTVQARYVHFQSSPYYPFFDCVASRREPG